MTACENIVKYNIFYAHKILIYVYMYMYNTCTQLKLPQFFSVWTEY